MKKIKTIIFDLDNTLVNFMKMKNEGIRAAICAMIDAGLAIDKEEGYKKMFYTYLKVGIESDIAFTEFLKNETGKADKKILEAAISAYLEAKSKSLELYPDVISTLEKLKRKSFALVILTDAPKAKAHHRMTAMKIDHFFDFIFTFDDTNEKKKKEIPLKTAIEKLKLNPKETIMVGDSIKRDVIPARKNDVISVWAKYGSSEKVNKIKPDYELDKFSDILKLV